MKNICFIVLAVLFSLFGCGPQQPWNPQDVAQDLANSDKTPQTATQDLAHSDKTPQTATQDLAHSNKPPQEEIRKISFDDEIKPLFQARCTACHGAMDPKINWLDEPTAIEYVKNGELYNRVWKLKKDPDKGMPQRNATGMTEEEREIIVEWINYQQAQLGSSS